MTVRYLVATKTESKAARLKREAVNDELKRYVYVRNLALAAVARAICPSVPSVKATEGRGTT